MPAVVKKCTFSEIEAKPSFPALAREYAAEAAIHGLPPAGEKFATYRALDASGIFHLYGAFVDGNLVGFISFLQPVLPHYGVAVAVSESVFVAKEYRKTGAGLKLLRAAQRHARDTGSPGFLVSAPAGGQLAEVLPGLGYRETNRVFFLGFANV